MKPRMIKDNMKIKRLRSLITAAVGLMLIVTTITASAQTQTSDTRIGKLSFPNGFPIEETTRKLFYEMDYQRAVQAYLWAYPNRMWSFKVAKEVKI